MQRKYIIKKQTDIESVIKTRQVVKNYYFSIYYDNNLINNSANFMFCLSIGKKFGKAYQRNKIKRQIREIIRHNKTKIKNISFVIIIRPQANTLSFQENEKNILFLLKKGRILLNEEN